MKIKIPGGFVNTIADDSWLVTNASPRWAEIYYEEQRHPDALIEELETALYTMKKLREASAKPFNPLRHEQTK